MLEHKKQQNIRFFSHWTRMIANLPNKISVKIFNINLSAGSIATITAYKHKNPSTITRFHRIIPFDTYFS